MPNALIVWGGWMGHEPEQAAEVVRGKLAENGFAVEVADTLDAFKDEEKLAGLDLIVPCWTMGKIEKDQLQPVLKAVAGGVGLGGWHGGMCDAFRDAVAWQFMCGGQWVAHPGGDGIDYTVRIVKDETSPTGASPITAGMADFAVKSEQYYMHVDPAARVLATTDFGGITMPVTWTKMWGRGRVFYTSLGHKADIVALPEVLEMITRGLLWAAEGKQQAQRGDLTVARIHQDLAGAF